MRGQTYSERLRELDRQSDYSYWKRRFEKALSKHNLQDIEDLIKEAIEEDFDVPYIADPEAREIYDRLK